MISYHSFIYGVLRKYVLSSHFNLVLSKSQMYILDARSTNGTKLNGGNVSAERYFWLNI